MSAHARVRSFPSFPVSVEWRKRGTSSPIFAASGRVEEKGKWRDKRPLRRWPGQKKGNAETRFVVLAQVEGKKDEEFRRLHHWFGWRKRG